MFTIATELHMTLTKHRIVQNIHLQPDLPKCVALETTQVLLEIIKSILKSGEDFQNLINRRLR
jgi:hypothetical protein